MRAYYNEIDRFCCDWLSNLMDAGHITPGVIDDRDIRLVQPADLRGFTRCHFFAGFAGWDLALNLAGWGDRPVWTGSCPCQPVSSAGQRKGHADERHLWPAFYRLISECWPSVCFGEQVAGKDGREWLSAVRADLEESGYAVGAADLCAAGVGAPHIRQRLFWVANADQSRYEVGIRLARDDGTETEQDRRQTVEQAGDRLGNPQAIRRGQECQDEGGGIEGGQEEGGQQRPWDNCIFIPCADGRLRPTPEPESGIFPLAPRLPNRVGRLRAYGNAIVPQVAARFIQAVDPGLKTPEVK